MNRRETTRVAIQSVIRDMMDNVIKRVLVDDPFIEEEHHKKRPLYAALVPDEIFKSAHFERRFVTPFGKVWEKLAIVAAEIGLGYAAQDQRIDGLIKEGRLRRITEVLNKLEHPGRKEKERTHPDWNRELQYIRKGKGKIIRVSVVCDVYAENKESGKKYAFEIKAPLPNSDQTKVSKEKLLKLYCMDPPQISDAYFALPYNPYISRDKYDWSFPARWFDMRKDKVVLIGDEFWEKIGGPGTYESFINAINDIGVEYKDLIYREFLGIDPNRIDNRKHLG